MSYFIKQKNKKRAFSLVEILITILIVSILMVIAAPILTKRARNIQTEGIVFAYMNNNITETDNRCYATVANYADPTDEEYIKTKNCSEYTFTVPEGVTSVNFTLVAGGGGGGGAAGGLVVNKDMFATGDGTKKVTESTTQGFILDILKNIRINFMTGAGRNGGEPTLSSTLVYTAGEGGESSPYIMNFDVPYEYIKGPTYENVLSSRPSTIKTGYLTAMAECDGGAPGNIGCARVVFGTSNAVGWDSNVISYRIDNSITNYTQDVTDRNYGCVIGRPSDNDYPRYNEKKESDGTQKHDATRVCKIPRTSLFVPSPGEKGDKLTNTESIFISSHLVGGEGGKMPLAAKGHGVGGRGASMVAIRCDVTSGAVSQYCKRGKTAFKEINESERLGSPAYVSVTYTTERAGGTGGGGGAGAVLRIKNFAVRPQETYKVFVGAGGEGGVPGVSSEHPTDVVNGGKSGFGGVSTAIYDSLGNLILMVNGGAGGEGGKVPVDANTDGVIGVGGANVHRVFANDNVNLANIDTAISSAAGGATKNIDDTTYTSKSNLSYPNLNEEPYATFTANKINGITPTHNYSNRANLYSSFSEFSRENNPKIRNNRYDGLYYRTITGNTVSYVGGLGGHSGLGGRAGCGGYFMGNFDGRITADSAPNANQINRNLINSVIFTETGEPYNIFNYYENCNNKNSDGQSAKVILPNISPRSYGQAGSGGGGGGYNILNGPGKGGNGQDGYVMIDWRK